MAPPNSSNFSVSVVLPASGWEMLANVLLFFMFSAIASLNIGHSLSSHQGNRLSAVRQTVQKRSINQGSSPLMVALAREDYSVFPTMHLLHGGPLDRREASLRDVNYFTCGVNTRRSTAASSRPTVAW